MTDQTPMTPSGRCSIAAPDGGRTETDEPHHWVSRKGANTIFVRTCSMCGEIDWDDLHEETVKRVVDEVDRLHTWDGLMSLLDQHWPEDLYPTREDGDTRDSGPRIVSLLRWIDRRETQLRRVTQRANEARDRADRQVRVHLEVARAAERERDGARAVATDAIADAPSRRDLLLAEEAMRAAQLGQHKAERERDRATSAAHSWEGTAAQHYRRLVEYRDDRHALAAKVDAVRKVPSTLRYIVGDGTRSEVEVIDAAEELIGQALAAPVPETSAEEFARELWGPLEDPPQTLHRPAQRVASGPDTTGGSTDRGTDEREPHARSEPVQWGQGKDCPHRPEWHCSSHGECRGCECGCDTVNGAVDLTSAHWLVFNTATRQITGCHCGFRADMDADCGWGDSVVAHLIEVGTESAAQAEHDAVCVPTRVKHPACACCTAFWDTPGVGARPAHDLTERYPNGWSRAHALGGCLWYCPKHSRTKGQADER